MTAHAHDSTAVLVVDGNVRLAEVVSSLFADEPGFRVTGVVDSAAAALLAASDEHPHVVLVDERLPGGGGYALARAIRGVAPEAAVLLWTHDAGRDVPSVDVDGVLERGMTFRDLVREVRRALRRSRAAVAVPQVPAGLTGPDS